MAAQKLPQEIIQHIQSLMDYKLSAQTSLLSKSWYNAWSTRPNLYLNVYFNSWDFRNDNFVDYVTRTVQRYLDLNIKVSKLHLTTPNSLCYKLLVDIFKLRFNELRLYFKPESGYSSYYVLPAQVFANKYLTELHLTRCKIGYLDLDNILCSNLKSLELSSVYIEDNTFKNILVRCPVIQHLWLGRFIGLTRINASELLNLKTLIVEGSAFENWDLTPSVICGPFLNLTRLELRHLNVDDSFFTNISSNFPKLKDLTVVYLQNIPTFQILSHSITSLSLYHIGIVKMVELDVPNIRNFKFSGNHVPPLSFTASSSKEWKSDISFYGTIDLSKLREFLIRLGQSKITLKIESVSRNFASERNIENFHLPVVEELICNVANCEEYNFFVKCLLYCRPTLVSLGVCLDYQHMSLKTLSMQFMYKKLIEHRNQIGRSTTTQNSEFEEVNVELFEESLNQWQPVKTCSDDQEIPNHGAAPLRFKLKWGSLTPEYTVIKLIY